MVAPSMLARVTASVSTLALLALTHCSPDGEDTGSRINLGGGGEGAMANGSDSGVSTGLGGRGNINLGTGGEGGGRTPGADASCGTSTVEAEQIPANLLFVVDKSGSMNCCPPPVIDSAACENAPVRDTAACADSKWEITRDALVSAIDGLRTLGNVSVGMAAFPTDGACLPPSAPDVELGPLTDAHFTDVETFLGQVTPRGSTPLVGATTLSYAYLQSTIGEARLASENTFVVMVTDGAESCIPAADRASQVSTFLNQTVSDALSINIRTFVIGAPGSEGALYDLSKMAAHGGTARTLDCLTEAPGASADGGAPPPSANVCHFDMTTSTDFAAELRSALDAISQAKELTCDFDVPQGARADLGKVNVEFEPGSGAVEKILKDDSEACDAGAEGWQYAENDTKIRLCGAICERVSADRTGRVRIVLGCETDTIR